MIQILSEDLALPVSVGATKDFLRLSTSQDDDVLVQLIRSAVEEVEAMTGRLLKKCLCKMTCDLAQSHVQGLVQREGREVLIRIPHVPFLRIMSVTLQGREIRAYTLRHLPQDMALCQVGAGNGTTLCLTYEAGHQEGELFPEVLRMAILEIVAFRYQHRGEGQGTVPGMAAFLGPYRVLHL